MIQTKLLSSLDKCFPDENLTRHTPVKKLSVLKNQRFSLQFAFVETDLLGPHRRWVKVAVDGAPGRVEVRLTENVPSAMPLYPGRGGDENYLRLTPGLYPDLLRPLSVEGSVPLLAGQLRTAWIDVFPEGSFAPGEHTVSVSLVVGEETVGTQSLALTVIDADLPANELYVTQWFHCDCLADYYGVKVFSERHWEIMENFARTAVAEGINLILTPIFTPPLDTHIGGERPTVQLVGVRLDGDEYSFDFSLLDRFIDMCDRVGIRYFEISHLFSQWGAYHTPKIVATVNGRKKKLFGWQTDATGEAYTAFLHAFLPAFLDHMKARGDDKRCLFHISDEPNAEQLEQYRASKAIVADLLRDYTIMDALSSFDFFEKGVVKTPIPANNHIEPFLRAQVPGLWTYYCCGQTVGVSNRLFAMPGARTRCIGLQFFKYDIVGFLQWGYNFYYNQGSYDMVNPFLDSTGEYFFPSGDGYSVYPAPDGTAWESMRLLQFREALEDTAAMKLAASFVGKDEVVRAVEAQVGEIRFDRCLSTPEQMLCAREAVNAIIRDHVK